MRIKKLYFRWRVIATVVALPDVKVLKAAFYRSCKQALHASRILEHFHLGPVLDSQHPIRAFEIGETVYDVKYVVNGRVLHASGLTAGEITKHVVTRNSAGAPWGVKARRQFVEQAIKGAGHTVQDAIQGALVALRCHPKRISWKIQNQ